MGLDHESEGLAVDYCCSHVLNKFLKLQNLVDSLSCIVLGLLLAVVSTNPFPFFSCWGFSLFVVLDLFAV